MLRAPFAFFFLLAGLVACESDDLGRDAESPSSDATVADATDVAPPGPSEVSADLPLADAPLADAPSDAPADIAPGSEAAFRVLSLGLASPDLCYPPGASCMPLNQTVTVVLQDAIDDPSDPFVLVGLFHDFLEPGGVHTLTFGAGVCEGAGVDWSCAADTTNPAAVSSLDVTYAGAESCPDGGELPCFTSAAADVLLALPAFGGSLGLRQAVLSGRFSTKDTVEDGVLNGFLPRSLAETYAFGGLGAEPVLLADLFEDAPTVLDGEPGWWVKLTWWAVKVDWNP